MKAFLLFATGLMIQSNVRATVMPPSIASQPSSHAANPGSSTSFSVSASGSPPLRFQWRQNGLSLEGRTNATLTLTNLHSDQQGDYTVVVANDGGAVPIRVASLEIVSGFTRVTNSTLARGGTQPLGAAWGDFNNDGWVDLVAASAERYLIHTNRGDGTFAAVTNRILGGELNGGRTGMAWADFDNDGNLDLAIGGNYTVANTTVYVYRNRGDGQFDRLTTNLFLTSGLIQYSASWADYDNDGMVDLFIPAASNGGGAGANDLLFRNLGGGSFTRVTDSLVAQDNDRNQGVAWGDFDNDGDLDLFAAGGLRNHLYRNQGGGSFTLLTNSPVSLDGGSAGGCAWGDYDNDGDLDLFVTSFSRNAWLYRNEAGVDFTRITNAVVLDGPSAGCTWVDFDNDGWLDLVSPGPKNLVYHNRGDGTFLRVTAGEMVTQSIASWGNNSFASADADRDGFPDLLWVDFSGNSEFYHNKGNDNAWLSVRCDGRLSNRAGIGAKVRIKAIIAGRELWQLREIGGGGLVFTQNEPVAHFGLGEATNADLVRIEWPSGIVQELRDVRTRQFLTVVEPEARISPVHIEAEAGAAVTFSVTTSLTPPVQFQWRLNGMALVGETNQMLVITNTQAQHGGKYSVAVVHLETGLAFETRPALLKGPVVIEQQPASVNVRPGSNAVFRVTASGIGALTYQWHFNGTPVAGATNTTLAITNCQLAEGGRYEMSIANSYGPVVSVPAILGILINPAFVQHPVSQSVAVGGSVTFSVAVTGNPAPFTFEWRRGGAVLITNVLEQAVCFLTLTNVQTNHAGLYRVVVKNPALPLPGILSSGALLTVLPDTDGDGLPDDWETVHKLNILNATDAAGDEDGDGFTNRQEYEAGTDPHDAPSHLRIESLSAAGSNSWSLQFQARSNLTYTVEAQPEFSTPTWLRVFDVAAAATNRLLEINLPRRETSPPRYFRLVTPRRP